MISYDRYVRKYYSEPVATLEYSFGNDLWVKAHDIDKETEGVKTETFTLDATALAGHDKLRFRWAFEGIGIEAYLVIDNVKVAYETPTQAVLRYYAGENGKLREGTTTDTKEAIELTTTIGVKGTKITAVPAAGYVFDRWSDDFMSAERQDDNNITVTALFKPEPKPTHVIQYKAGEHGMVTGLLYQVLEEGATTANVSAIADAGYTFKRWNDGRIDNPRTDVVGTEDKTYTAEFAQVFTLTYEAGEHGSIKGEATQNVFAGESGSAVEAVPDYGYRFVKWDDNKTDNPRTELNVTESKTYKAAFEAIPTYAVTLKHDGEGELKITGIEEDKLNAVLEGTELTAVATPKTGWKLESLMAGTQDIKADGKFTVTADVEVKAVFVKSTSVDDAVFANVLVAPNPFDNQLRIMSYELRGEYALLNAQGIMVASGVLEGAETHINTSSFPAGMYLLRLSTESGATKTYRVIKQ